MPLTRAFLRRCLFRMFSSSSVDLIEVPSKSAALRSLLRTTDYLKNADLVFAVDLDHFESNVLDLKNAFAGCPKTLHTFAIKANPSAGLLRRACQLGLGAEVASWGEVLQAKKCGFEAHRIVFDSPAKTRQEIRQAIELGVHINIDSLQELEIVAAEVESMTKPLKSRIGVRVNPQLGAGTIIATSTSTQTSKFGVALRRNRAELIAAFLNYRWLTGIHVHGGSQGCSYDLLSAGVQEAYQCYLEISNARLQSKLPALEFLDIGGGMAVSYVCTDPKATFSDYVSALRNAAPGLFSSNLDRSVNIVTEFGRALVANCGWAVARVKFMKDTGLDHSGHQIAVTDYGADADLRNAYLPGVFPRIINVYNCSGEFKERDICTQAVAGPLCFSGDMLTPSRPLPRILQGDLLLIHNTGAYTLSMWSRYNSRCAPALLGYSRRGNCGSFDWTLLKRAETCEDVIRSWED
jgi:diaminopimelate decarboxylase